MKVSVIIACVAVFLCHVVTGFMIAPSSFTGAHLSGTARASASPASGLAMRTRICDLLGKRANRKARVVTFSHKRIHKVQEVNLQKRRLYWEEADRWVRLRLSTKGIKTIDKYGLDKAAKKFGLDLEKYAL